MTLTHQKCPKITLLPQEREGDRKFDGRFVATRAAHESFGELTIIRALGTVRKQVTLKGGLSYLQVLDIDGQKLWLIDDGEVVTALLPDDY